MGKNRLKDITIVLALWFSPLMSQEINFDEQKFFENLKTSYYTLEQTSLNNVVSLVTSEKTEQFADKNWQNPEIFPLQMIWVKPNSIYISEQGVPPLPDEAQLLYRHMIDELKQQFKSILLDLKTLYLNGIYSSISNDYQLIQDNQIVQVSFSIDKNENMVDYRYTFEINGICHKIEAIYQKDNYKKTFYPKFRTVKTKWICEGWDVQINNNVQLINGYSVLIKNKVVQGIFVPTEISIESQNNTGENFKEVIKIKNYLFNQPLQLLNGVKGDR